MKSLVSGKDLWHRSILQPAREVFLIDQTDVTSEIPRLSVVRMIDSFGRRVSMKEETRSRFCSEVTSCRAENRCVD